MNTPILVTIHNCVEVLVSLMFSSPQRSQRLFKLWTGYLCKTKNIMEIFLNVILLAPIHLQIHTDGIYLFKNKIFFVPRIHLYQDEADVFTFMAKNKKSVFRQCTLYPSFNYLVLSNQKIDYELRPNVRISIAKEYINYIIESKTDLPKMHNICFSMLNSSENINEDIRNFLKTSMDILKIGLNDSITPAEIKRIEFRPQNFISQF